MKSVGNNRLSATGALVVTNSLGTEQMLELQRYYKKPLRFITCLSAADFAVQRWPAELKVENVPAGASASVIEQLVHSLLSGEGAWFLPVGRNVVQPHLMALHDKIADIAREARKAVYPVWVEDPSAPLYNFALQKTADWLKRSSHAEKIIAVGDPIPPDEVNSSSLRHALLEVGSEAYAARDDLKVSLQAACVEGLKQRGSAPLVTDAYLNNKELSGRIMLGLGLAVSKKLRKLTASRRLGIVLPPGIATMVTNLGCILCGKIPVNLNFTAGRASNEIAIKKAGLDTVLTVPTLQDRFKDFPWPKNTVDVQSLLKNLPKPEIILHTLKGALLPTSALASIYGFPTEGGDIEAALLFSSGSTGEPKGIPLTHRNIVSNITQVRETLQFPTDHKLLGCLPTFHSFGFTVTVWYPMCGGPHVVTYINPLEAAKLSEIIHEHKIQLAVSTPTFLRGYLKRATREQLSSLWGVVTGAEKLPLDLAEQFEEKFGVPVREGYGLTETTPVVSVNLNDPPDGSKDFPGQSLNKRGSVGRPLPGIAVRITNPQTDAQQEINSTGMIWLKGPNIFKGYLDDPERSAEVLHDGWFKTGDLGRIDEEGFLHIEGRISRFSKIGGEMVPHGAIESLLQRIFAPESEIMVFAVTGRAHAEKGEELVLLTTLQLTTTTIGEALRKEGIPNLWVPKVVKLVEKIPVLASGKLDLQTLKKLAEAA